MQPQVLVSVSYAEFGTQAQTPPTRQEYSLQTVHCSQLVEQLVHRGSVHTSGVQVAELAHPDVQVDGQFVHPEELGKVVIPQLAKLEAEE